MAASPYRAPCAPSRNRLPLLAAATVRTPCKVAWRSMEGDERRRFCFACRKDVYDLAAMSEDEAESFLAVHLDDDPEAGARLFRRPDGRLLTADCPVGATRRHRRRAALAVIAGALFVASVAALVADLHVPRERSAARAGHSRFEPPRPLAEWTAGAGMSTEVSEPGLWSNTGQYAQVRALNAALVDPEAERRSRLARAQGLTEQRPSPLRSSGVASRGLPPEVVNRVVGDRTESLFACYEAGRLRRWGLAGTVAISFTIDREGAVPARGVQRVATAPSEAHDWASPLDDDQVLSCMMRIIASLRFPPPEPGSAEATMWMELGPT